LAINTDNVKYEVIICLSDSQFPFEHPKTFYFYNMIKNEYYVPRRTKIVHLGDEMDFHALSHRWPSDPDGLSARDEFYQGVTKMYALYEMFDEMALCISNHTWRPYKKAFLAGLPSLFLKSINDLLDAPPSYQWADKWIINDIVFEHGEAVGGKTPHLAAATQNRKPTVIGHQHRYAGVAYADSPFDTLWGMNVGCTIDWKNAYNFNIINCSNLTWIIFKHSTYI